MKAICHLSLFEDEFKISRVYNIHLVSWLLDVTLEGNKKSFDIIKSPHQLHNVFLSIGQSSNSDSILYSWAWRINHICN